MAILDFFQELYPYGNSIGKFEFPIPNHFLENQFGISKIKIKNHQIWTLQQAHTF
jgi:hypothetical protein